MGQADLSNTSPFWRIGGVGDFNSIESKPVQSLKQSTPKVVIDCGISNFCKFAHPLKALEPIETKEEGKWICSKP